MRSCFFIGHRNATEALQKPLANTVEQHIIQHGVTSFIVGQYGTFDHLAGKTVLEAKKRHPQVTLDLLLPYHPFERPIPIPDGFDGTVYPSGMERVPRRFAILLANRYMVDHSDFLIAYARYPGNARDLVEYAQKREKRDLIQVTLIG